MIRYNTKRLWGYSTDIKPMTGQIGDRFLDLDTRLEYVFTEYNEWSLINPPAYKVYTALLTQSGGDDPQTITSGVVTQGFTYYIDGADIDSDFSNVGGPIGTVGDGTYFVATNSAVPNNYGAANITYNNGAPVVTVLENTIGNIWFTYDDVGSYIVSGNFPSNKTTCIISNIGQVPSDDISIRANIDTDSIYLVTTSVSFAGTSAYSDDILQTTPIEIRVYN
jgi:hypothetical protein